MSHRQNSDGVLAESVADHITAVTGIDDPIAKLLVHVLNGTPNAWLLFHYIDTLADCFHGPLGSVRIFGCKEVIKTLHIKER